MVMTAHLSRRVTGVYQGGALLWLAEPKRASPEGSGATLEALSLIFIPYIPRKLNCSRGMLP